MIAVSLLDAVTRADQPQAVPARTVELAGQLIDASLAERRRIRQLEAEFAPAESSDAQAVMDIERSIHSLYSGWVAEGEQILLRVRRLISSGLEVRQAAEMEDAYASTLSRLKFTPEKTSRGMEQARRGEFTPAEDLRNELRARIRS